MKNGSFQLMKKINQQNILKLIHERDGISRAQIAEKTGLSPATVSNIVKNLLERDLVMETAAGKSRGGRKPVLLEVNPDGAYVIGIEWGITDIKAVLLDLDNNVVKYDNSPVKNYSLDYYMQLTIKMVNEFREIIKQRDKIFGIGLGIHGLVDPNKGFSLYTPHFQWGKKNIKALFNKYFDYPLFIDNDVRMMAMAEKWGNNKDNFIYINTGSGIGAAIVANGSLFYGVDWTAGEFGHMKIIDQGPICSCGNRGCLEALISLEKIIEKYRPETKGQLNQENLKAEWERFVSSVSDGEDKAREILSEAMEFLGIGIANVVNLLNPEEVIIGGVYADIESIILPEVIENVRERVLSIPGKNLKITSSVYGGKSGSIGAASRVLQELFKLNRGG